ncbi:cytochrome P450 81E8-like [Phalaenopsis equestris]|uniref:cytochrome P450 81E8-like n=1 Tax=Phalaenopsis equestris TaxID=78828 RepID=UPI0009E40ADA|nr:cytochrome P450 81E8-like [Phalaenopsis equestris]
MDIIISIFTYGALFLFLLQLTKHFLISSKGSRTRNLPPSPPSLPIIGHLHHLKKPLHQYLARLSAQHGPILLLRFGVRPVLVVSSAALAEECLTTNDIAFANRPMLPSFKLSTYNYTNIATSNYGPGWREMRRIATIEALSGHRLAFFSDVRADEARDLARRLFRETEVGGFTRVEIRSRLYGLAMNVMMRVMVGKRCYGEENGDEEAQRFKKMVEEAFADAGASNVGDFLPTAIGWFLRRSVERKLARIHSYRDGFLQGLVDERRRKRRVEEDEGRSASKTMLDAILSMQKDQPEQYTDTFIKALFVTLLAAGTDTSSNTIEWALSLLLNNPEKLALARKEIDEKVGHDRLFDESDLTNLSYLHCIINETLRLYPVVPLLLPHHSLEPCKVGGYDISPGTMLMVNAYVIQRDPNIWSKPTEFIPERFQDAEAERGKILPFGMGRRKCPGEGLAMREVGLVLGTLIQCFEWRETGPEGLDLKEGAGITMPKANPLEAMCRPREVMVRALSQL